MVRIPAALAGGYATCASMLKVAHPHEKCSTLLDSIQLSSKVSLDLVSRMLWLVALLGMRDFGQHRDTGKVVKARRYSIVNLAQSKTNVAGHAQR
jgi:hypothetical protein